MAIIEQYQNQIWILKLLQPGKACLLVGGPLLTPHQCPTFVSWEKNIQNPPSFGGENLADIISRTHSKLMFNFKIF